METLKQNIERQNEFNKIVLNVLEAVIPQLKQYQGKKIENANGQWNHKFVVNIPKEGYQSIYLKSSANSLVLSFSVPFQGLPDKNGVSVSTYYKDSYFLGEINNGILTEIREPNLSNLKVVIDYEEEQKKLDELKQLSKQFGELKEQFKGSREFLRYI